MDKENYRMIIERTYVSPSGETSSRPLYIAGPSGSINVEEIYEQEIKINPGYKIKYEWGGNTISNL